MNRLILTAVVSFISLQVVPQEKKQIDYLGQRPPGMVAERFAPGIVSTEKYEHSSPAFSSDGSVVVWAVYHGNSYLLECRLVNGAWTMPERPSFTDTLHGYVYPSFSPDGKKLFFSSDRKVPEGYRQGNGNRIWQVEKTKDGWGEPVPFDTTASQSSDYANSISNDGSMYFSSGIRLGTNWNIRRSQLKNGRYMPPELLPYNINSKDYEDGPYIAPDESFLIFESQRPEGTDGNLSLFISFKNEEGLWSLPLNMGPRINSGKGERFARLSPDGKYLFFGSFRDPAPGSRGADIYWIDAKVIEELRQSVTITFIEPTFGNSILTALDKKDVKTSAELLKSWLQLYPHSMDARVIFSSMLRRQKRSSEAEKLFMPYDEQWNNNTGIVMEMALVRFGLNDEAGARKLLSPLLAQPMDLRNKYNHLAEELFSMEAYILSDEFFNSSMAIRPNATGFYNRACAYALIGERSKAFTLLNKAIDHGFNSKKEYENDPDLHTLKEDARWKELLIKLK